MCLQCMNVCKYAHSMHVCALVCVLYALCFIPSTRGISLNLELSVFHLGRWPAALVILSYPWLLPTLTLEADLTGRHNYIQHFTWRSELGSSYLYIMHSYQPSHHPSLQGKLKFFLKNQLEIPEMKKYMKLKVHRRIADRDKSEEYQWDNRTNIQKLITKKQNDSVY